MNRIFQKFSQHTSQLVGTPWAFILAVSMILIWILSGPFFQFSNTWQLVINTGTTIITFLMVFLIQNTQNRDSKATHLKLDELIKSVSGARNALLLAEQMDDKDLEEVEKEFQQVQERARKLSLSIQKTRSKKKK